MPDELKSNRARVVEATGGADAPEEAPVKVNKLKNFFFHRAFIISACALAAVLIAFAVWNHFTTDKTADVNAIFAGPYKLTANDGGEITEALFSVQGEGAKKLAITDISWYSSADLKKLGPARASLIGAVENQAELDRFHDELTNSDALLLFISPELEAEMKDALVPISEIFPDGAPEWVDAGKKSLRLGDLPIYEAFPAIGELPENTRVCVRRASSAPALENAKDEDKKALEDEAAAILRAIASFEG